MRRKKLDGLRSEQAEVRLRHLLAEARVDLAAPSAADVERTWSVLREFAREPVADVAPPEQRGDSWLAQFGTWDRGDGERFTLDITRQFTFNDRRGQFIDIAQLRCEFEFEPTAELRELGADDIWSVDTGAGQFFEKARALAGFSVVQRQELRPVRLRVDYHRI